MDSALHKVHGATNKFEFISLIGSMGDGVKIPSEGKSILYSELDLNYSLKIKIVLKQKGLFAFFIPNLMSNGIRGKNCTNAGFSNTLTNTNKNLNLFQYAMNRPPVSQFEIDRIYCFRVQ